MFSLLLAVSATVHGLLAANSPVRLELASGIAPVEQGEKEDSSRTASAALGSHGMHSSFPASNQRPTEAQGERSPTAAGAESPLALAHDLRGAWLTDATRGRIEAVSHGPVPRQSVLLPILMYHHVKPIDARLKKDSYGRELTLPPAEFEWQLRYLLNRGFQTTTMADLALHIQGRKDLPPRSIILTFDDGYDDSYLFVFPLLRRYGLTGSFFITTGLVGLEGYVNWPQVRWMAANGMEIGSHLLSHVDLVWLSPAQRERELRESRRILEEETGLSVRSLAYPGGAHNVEVAAAARKAGYAVAVTTQFGAVHDRSKPLELARVRISGWENPSSFRSKIEQFFPVGEAEMK